MEDGIVVQRIGFIVEVEGEVAHTAENGYECDDPECICHGAEESDALLPVPWNALRARS